MSVKEKFITPFIAGSDETFASMCELSCSKDGEIRSVKGAVAVSDIVCIIGFAGQVKGAVILSMTMELAKKLVSTFICEDVSDNMGDLTDGYGELLNIIVGAALAKIEGLEIKFSLPTILTGKEKIVVAKHDTVWAEIPMIFEDGTKFTIDLSLEEK